MLDDNKDLSEKIKIVDHYSQKLINFGYSKEKVRDIVRSGLKGIMRKESKRMKLSFKYRGAHETLGDRLSKKLLEATTWCKKGGENEEKEDLVKENKYREGIWKKW